MNTHSTPLYPAHGFPGNWSALDLADAVPLRLSERIKLGLVEITTPTAANGPFAAPGKRNWRRGYLAGSELNSFRVR